MKDSDLRAVVLQKLYDLRKDGRFHHLRSSDIDHETLGEYNRVAKQLGDIGYIDWIKFINGDGQGRITAKGVDVLEGNSLPAIAITMNDHSVHVQGSSNVQIGSGNTIKTGVDIGKIEQAIDRLPIPEVEKADTKSLLSRISGNASFASLVGAIATMVGGSAQ